jgi:Zn-dependent protease with chaperone function
MPPRFQRKRWRRPQRLTVEGLTLARRKDVTVPDIINLEPSLAWHDNRRRMAVLLVAFMILSGVEGFVIGVLAGARWLFVPALFFAFMYILVGARYGDGWMRGILRAEPTTDAAAANLLDGLARQAGIPSPRLLVCEGEAPNAIALGLRRRWIALTTGALHLGRLELEALLAHEVSHLVRGDAALAAAYALIGGALELGTKGLRTPGGLAALLALPLWPACLVVRAIGSVLMREDRESHADIAGAMLTRYPPGMRMLLRASAVEHSDSRLRVSDPFWTAPRLPNAIPDIHRRATLVGEM